MTRHSSLAEQLAAIRRAVTEPDHLPEPLQTNWSITVANDNNPEDIEGLKVDRLWDISPSTGEIMRQVLNSDEVKNERGQTVRWGSLRFSDGTQTEQGFKVTVDGEVVAHQFVVPPGGMLGTTDKERVQRGGDENPEDATSTRNYFSGKETDFRPAGLFKALRSKPVKRAKRKDRTGPKTKAEERQWLADAIAGTKVMPVVKKIEDGFPASPAKGNGKSPLAAGIGHYRRSPKARWQFADLTLAAIRKLKDGQGNYLWQMGDITKEQPGTLLGYRYEINDDVPLIAAGAKPIIFGDFSKYFVRKVGSPVIGVLRERFWPDLGIAGLIRFDGELGDTAAIKHLVMAAS